MSKFPPSESPETLLEDLISLSINDANKRTGIPKTTLYDLMNSGKLETFMLGRRRFIDAASLRRLIAVQKETAPALHRRRYFGANAPPRGMPEARTPRVRERVSDPRHRCREG